MKYFFLNYEQVIHYNEDPVVIKVPESALKIVGQMGALARKHRELDRKLIQVLAEANNESEDEVSDTLCSQDFLVDVAEYGVGFNCAEEITKEEYKAIKDQRSEA